MADLGHLSSYDFELPDDLIAHEPLADRAAARLLVIDRASQSWSHRSFAELPQLLRAGDRLVLNDTRVTPARLFGVRVRTGGRWEGLFLRETSIGEIQHADVDTSAAEREWVLIGQTRGTLQPGELIQVDAIHRPGLPPVLLEFHGRTDDGNWRMRPRDPRSVWELLDLYGTLPLPPYLGRKVATEDDRTLYQTVYADRPGAVAAPTAGLHFTDQLLAECRLRGVTQSRVTLHVGLGTFRPVSVERLDDHVMHAEWAEVSPQTASDLAATHAAGGRVVAVGTTSVRTLESAAAAGGSIAAFCGDTSLFIRPGFSFRVVDALVTNFHLPKSTLLVMLSAFAGHELIMQAYHAAIAERYRFYSFGDAMLVQ